MEAGEAALPRGSMRLSAPNPAGGFVPCGLRSSRELAVRRQQIAIARERLSSTLLSFTMKPVLPDKSLHVVTPEPDGAPASERRIACGEHDLFATAHAQHFVRHDQWPATELLRARS